MDEYKKEHIYAPSEARKVSHISLESDKGALSIIGNM